MGVEIFLRPWLEKRRRATSLSAAGGRYSLGCKTLQLHNHLLSACEYYIRTCVAINEYANVSTCTWLLPHTRRKSWQKKIRKKVTLLAWMNAQLIWIFQSAIRTKKRRREMSSASVFGKQRFCYLVRHRHAQNWVAKTWPPPNPNPSNFWEVCRQKRKRKIKKKRRRAFNFLVLSLP